MLLHQAFDVMRGDVISFIGAGGKTSALVGLAYELVELGWRVLATTTIYIDEHQLSLMPYSMLYTGDSSAISEALNAHKFVFLYERIEDGKVYPPKLDWTPRLMDSVDSDVLLIEADKSDGRGFKAPYDHEPNIPEETSLVISCVGLNVIEKPFNEDYVYNPKIMTERYGFHPDTPIHAPWLGQVLRDEVLGMKGVPTKARVVAFLNQTPLTGYNRQRARVIARSALRGSRISAVAIGTVRGANPIYEVQRSLGAIILAAGMSTRMGHAKVLLPWEDDKPIIEHILEQLIRSRLDYINVVTGHYADEVKEAIKPHDVKVVHNRAYRTGEMLSSLQVGLKAFPDSVSAAMIVLGDQPRLEPKVLYRLMKQYAEHNATIAIPSYNNKRGHPIIIGRKYWKDILKLSHNATLRDILNKYADDILYVPVDTDSILRDVDTPFDYQQERLRAGLESINLDERNKKS
jgi:molybdenum cofactor cytidylyltransferase